MQSETVIAVISAAGGLIAIVLSVLRLPMERKRGRDEAAATLTDAATGLIEGLQEEIARLRERVAVLEDQAGGLQEALATAQRRVQRQARQIGELKNQLEMAEERILALKEENSRLQEGNR